MILARWISILLLLIFMVMPAWSFSGEAGATFLDMPIGAGPAALGGAYTALAVDAYAPVYNPAGLSEADVPQMAVQHLDYLEDVHDEHVSAAIPITERWGLGITGQYMGSGNLDKTDSAGTKTGDFSNSYAVLGLSSGWKIIKNFSLGITGKIIRGDLDGTTATAYAADLGGLLQVSKMISIGAVVTNMGSQLKFLDQSDSLPMAYRLGVAVRPLPAWVVTADGAVRQSALSSAHTGVEWRPFDVVALRIGYRSDTIKESDPVAGLTAGMAFRLWEQEFSYAILPLGDLGVSNYFSVLLRFGRKNSDGNVT